MNPVAVLVVALIATKASHAQSWYFESPVILVDLSKIPTGFVDMNLPEGIVVTLNDFWTKLVHTI